MAQTTITLTASLLAVVTSNWQVFQEICITKISNNLQIKIKTTMIILYTMKKLNKTTFYI